MSLLDQITKKLQSNEELLITYKCPECGKVWHEVYECACDSECDCGCQNIIALEWKEIGMERAVEEKDVQNR